MTASLPDRPPLAQRLDLQPHPEGGWFRQTWASSVEVTLADGRVRPTATLIWFWLPAGECSAWHRVASEEAWLAHRAGGARAGRFWVGPGRRVACGRRA